MKFDNRLRRLEDHYCRKIISCYLGTFQAKTRRPGEPISPVDNIIEELRREDRGVFPEALALLTPEERKKYKVQDELIKEAHGLLKKETKSLTKHYKPRVSKRKM